MNRDERLGLDIDLLRDHFPDLEYCHPWVRLPARLMPKGWEPHIADVALLIPEGYPGALPYGIYVPVGMRFNGQLPNNYTEPAATQPPFDGEWGVFSWTVESQEEWQVTTDVRKGANLLRWAQGFSVRFQEGI